MILESVIQVRLSNDDLKQLKELAKKERLNISAYCRKELSKILIVLQENPNIKLGRKSEDLEETEYVDGITPINTTEGLPGPATVINDSVPKIEPAIPVEKID